jgi:hypothetical protein
MEVPLDGVLYISTPLNGYKLSNDLVLSVEEMVGKKYFSISSGPFTSYSRLEPWPEDSGSQGIVAACGDGCFSVHSKLTEKSRETRHVLLFCQYIADMFSSLLILISTVIIYRLDLMDLL